MYQKNVDVAGGGDGAISSNAADAEAKEMEILTKLRGYTTYAAQSEAACSDGTPAADHDTAGFGYSSAIDNYVASLMRDAAVLLQIGSSFEGEDAHVASMLLGVGE